MQHFLQLCLQSVEAAIKNLDAEIIVVDNNSHDASCEMVKQLFPNVKLIENTENLGFSKGNNIGVQHAKGEYLCILNPDTVVTENTFLELLTFANLQKNLGIVGCRLIDGQGHYLPESKRNVPVVKVAFQKMIGNGKNYYANHLTENEIGKASIFVGAFMLIKRNIYKKVNGFDEEYFMYGEDIDLSYKILKAGYDNYYFGTTTIIHYKGESTLKDKTYAKRFYGAMQIFYKKHFKSNLFFDAMVWFGIQTAKWVNTNASAEEIQKQNFHLISNTSYAALEQKLAVELLVSTEIPQDISNTELILDANYLDFNTIIKIINTSAKNKGLTFKILPKNSNFIIGSNHSKSRGEVIHF